MNKQVFDKAFKVMDSGLSKAKNSVKWAAGELGMDPGRLSQWRQRDRDGLALDKASTVLNRDQKEIKGLQKELQEAQIERDILKKAVSIFFRGDEKYAGF